jgi:hypothetical protein
VDYEAPPGGVGGHQLSTVLPSTTVSPPTREIFSLINAIREFRKKKTPGGREPLYLLDLSRRGTRKKGPGIGQKQAFYAVIRAKTGPFFNAFMGIMDRRSTPARLQAGQPSTIAVLSFDRKQAQNRPTEAPHLSFEYDILPHALPGHNKERIP